MTLLTIKFWTERSEKGAGPGAVYLRRGAVRSPRRARSCKRQSCTLQCPLRVACSLCIPGVVLCGYRLERPSATHPETWRASDRVGGCGLCLSGSTALPQTV